MAAQIADLGGRTLALGGGVFLLSEPLVIPPNYGNLNIADGTLRASEHFDKARYLIEIGSSTDCHPLLPSGKPDAQASCNEFVNVQNVLLDASLVAAGGMRIAQTMGATVGPAAFFIGFTTTGLKVDKGHEVMLTEAWLASCYWSDSACKGSGKASNAIAVQINGNDHYLSNVIVFDYAHIGVEINGAANLLSSVHTWNGGGTGISLGNPTSSYGAHQNRLLGCYLDYNTLDMYDPSDVVIESTFFLETHARLLPIKGNVSGLTMRYNSYTTSQSVELVGAFHRVSGVSITEETNAAAFTRVKRSLSHKSPSTRWEFDFSGVLLFPHVAIDEVQYSLMLDQQQQQQGGGGSASSVFPRHVARAPNATAVVVETDQPVSGTVFIEVAQATRRA